MIGLRFPLPTGATPKISANGKVIIFDGPMSSPVICYNVYYFENLETLLKYKYGIDLTGWNLTNVTSISTDGKIISGNGRNPDRKYEAWIIFLQSDGLSSPSNPRIAD